MRPIPFNAGEAVFEPFWDPQISRFERFDQQTDDGCGVVLWQYWCFVGFRFERARPGQTVFSLSRAYPGGLDCAGYDDLLLSAMNVRGGMLRVSCKTDAGSLCMDTEPGGPLKREYALPLNGAARIDAVTISLVMPKGGAQASGWFNWLGLRNRERAEAHRAMYKCWDARWEGYLQPESFEPTFTPAYGILADKDELARMRREHTAFVETNGAEASPYVRAAMAARATEPEALISDFVNFWGDTRYCRESAHGNVILTKGMDAVAAAYLTGDKSLLRLAARYALSIAVCGNWDDGMICAFPGSPFEHRCFVQSLCALETAMILDLAGEVFTPLGRDLVLRRIAESSTAHINFSTWKHEYIFGCNQMAWFSPGRMYGYGALLHHYPRVRRYMDIAFDDLTETLERSLQPDGGYVEGPTYFQCVGSDSGRSLLFYARATGTGSIRELMPAPVLATGDFAECMLSTDEAGDMIPICDGRPVCDQTALAMMAYLLPESQWVRLYQKSLARSGLPVSIAAWIASANLDEAQPPKPRAFVQLPNTGHVSSLRVLGEKQVKWFLPGNAAGAGHTHEDKGSFVLEYGGETFLMDPGTCDYASPLSMDLKNCERHNMLLPRGLKMRPHPESPLAHDIHYAASGDERAFRASCDLSHGWEGFYDKWTRAFESAEPSRMTVTDAYRLCEGTGVGFTINTRLPVEETASGVVLRGLRGGVLTVTAPAGARVIIEELPLPDGAVQRRVTFAAEGMSGSLRTIFELS